MKRISAMSLVIAATLVGGCAGRTVHTITSAEQLIQSIGPNRTLRLTKRVYDLTNLRQRKMEYVVWRKVHDGYELCIRNVRNLRIEGVGKFRVPVTVQPSYAYVLSFEDVAGIRLRNLKLGHAPEEGHCTGGVARVVNAEDVTIENSVLFGCGTEGLTLKNVNDLTFTRSVIEGCTYGILTAENCRRLRFEEATFRNNRKYHGIVLHDSAEVSFADCRITGNTLSAMFDSPLFDLSSCSAVSVTGGVIRDNAYSHLVKPAGAVTFTNINIEANRKPAE